MVVSEHKLSREEWEEKIAKFHAKHHGMSRAEAMMEYLKVTTLTPHSVSGITAQKATAADSNAHCPFVIYAKHESCAKKLKFTAGQTRYTKVHKKSNFNSWFF